MSWEFEHDCRVNWDAWLSASISESCQPMPDFPHNWNSIHFLPSIIFSVAEIVYPLSSEWQELGGRGYGETLVKGYKLLVIR